MGVGTWRQMLLVHAAAWERLRMLAYEHGSLVDSCRARLFWNDIVDLTQLDFEALQANL